MTERNISVGVDANLQSRHTSLFILIEMQLTSGTLRITSLPHDVSWGGFTWSSTHGLGGMEPVKESMGEITGLAFTLSGVPTALLATILGERIFRRVVIVRLGTLDSAGTISMDENAWQGELDMPQIEASTDTIAIRITAESRMLAWRNARPVNFSDEQQKLVDATDTFFSRMSSMVNKQIIWPKKEYFQR